MKEIEVKILDAKHKEIGSKLLKLGAKKIFDAELDAIFFDTEDLKFRKTKQTLRLRKEGKKVFLTYKKKIPSKIAKMKDEAETEVSSFEDTKKIILSLGFKETDHIKKRRISYKIENTRFEFDIHKDKYKFIPEFMEIESDSIKKIHKYAKALGYSKEDCRAWSIKELVKHYL